MSSNFQLVMKAGPNPGQSFVLDGTEFSIGRDINNDFVINDTEMSRKHAKISVRGEGFVVEDLGSTNGTFVNGQRLMGIHLLVSGDTISFGENVTVVYEAPAFDPDATRVSAQPPSYAQPISQPPVYASPVVQTPSTPVHPQETFISAPPAQQYVSVPPTPASYSGEVPAAYPVAGKPKKKNRALLIIIIVLLLIVCGCIVFWLVVDTMNLYCDLFPGIMNAIFGSGSCP